jgi:hypothetical protein
VLPFTEQQYFGSLEGYGHDVGLYAQGLLYLIALLTLVFAYRERRAANVALAFLWVWAGSAYFMRYVAPMSPAGYAEGAVCFVQAFLCLKINFSPRLGKIPSTGGVIIFYAMVAYPTLGAFVGHGWPGIQQIGLHGPNAMFTIGLVLWAARSAPGYTLVIPLMIAVGGTIIGLILGSYEALGLLFAGAMAIAWMVEGKKEDHLARERLKEIL